MEKQSSNHKAPEQSGRGGSGLWSIGIYLCLAAVIFCLIFASCTGGAVYNPKETDASPSPLIGDTSPLPDADTPEDGGTAIPEDGTEGQDAVSPSPEA